MFSSITRKIISVFGSSNSARPAPSALPDPDLDQRIQVAVEESFSSSSRSSFSSSSSSVEEIPEEKPEEHKTELHDAIVMKNIHDQTQLEENLRRIERILNRGINPNIQNANGDTALHLVGDLSYFNRYHACIIDLLLKKGARVDINNLKGETALHKIVGGRGYSSSVEKILQAGGNPNGKDKEGFTPLHLLIMPSYRGFDPLDLNVLQALLKHNADVNLPTTEGNSALHLAIQGKRNLECLNHLLGANAQLNAQNAAGNTPLHLIAGQNRFDDLDHKRKTEWLITNGADRTLKNKSGELPYHLAYQRGGSEVLDLLQSGDVDLDSADAAGMTALHHAANDFDKDTEAFRKVLEKSKNLLAQDSFGKTALHYAAGLGFLEAVEMLLDKGFPVDVQDKDGDTALHKVIRHLLGQERSSYSKLEEVGEVIRVLHSANLRSSNSPRLKVSEGYKSEAEWQKKVINLLLERGANPYKPNVKGMTPVETCFDLGRRFTTFKTDEFFNKVRQSLYRL